MINKKYCFAKYKKNNPIEIIKKMLRVFIFHGIKIIEIRRMKAATHLLDDVLFFILLIFNFIKAEVAYLS
jgi:hypothetical protein